MTSTLPSSVTAAPGRLLVLAVPEQGQVVVLVAGELDCASAPLLREKVADSLFYRPRWLTVDATELTFCDMRGLRTLVDAVESVERSGAHVTLLPSPQLSWLLDTVRQLPRTSGQSGRDPSGCPLPRPARQPA